MTRRLREALSGGYLGENRKCKPVHYNVSRYDLYRGSLSHEPSEIGIGTEKKTYADLLRRTLIIHVEVIHRHPLVFVKTEWES